MALVYQITVSSMHRKYLYQHANPEQFFGFNLCSSNLFAETNNGGLSAVLPPSFFSQLQKPYREWNPLLFSGGILTVLIWFQSTSTPHTEQSDGAFLEL
jgi:hypothetical protein